MPAMAKATSWFRVDNAREILHEKLDHGDHYGRRTEGRGDLRVPMVTRVAVVHRRLPPLHLEDVDVVPRD